MTTPPTNLPNGATVVRSRPSGITGWQVLATYDDELVVWHVRCADLLATGGVYFRPDQEDEAAECFATA